MTRAGQHAPDTSQVVGVPLAALDVLMPMALIVAPTGHILHVGPTMAKLRPGRPVTGCRFLELFVLRRPRQIRCFADLIDKGGGPLQIQFRDTPQTALKGVGVVLPDGAGMLINLSFGIGAVEGPGAYQLNCADFAPTDLTLEMLYLVEANAAVQAELRRLNQRLHNAKSVAEELANTDPLTGLRNRRALTLALERYGTGSDPFGVMQLDLDLFKQVNDEYGHEAGDAVLRHVAQILQEETRDADTVVRTGGDEFVLIFHRMTDIDTLSAVAARLLDRLQRPVAVEGGATRISASIGIALSSEHAAPAPTVLLKDADAALYAAKKAGRGRYAFASLGAGATAPEAVRGRAVLRE